MKDDRIPLRPNKPLKECVAEALDQYFAALDGQSTCELYKMVMGETEEALLRYVLQRTEHNQTHTAEILGMNRGTLRKKLRAYRLIDPGN